MTFRSVVLGIVLTIAVALTRLHAIDPPGNAVTDWAAIVQPAIHSAAAPRSAGSAEVLHAMVALAMYDAAVAIEGGYEPYAGPIDAPAGADARAAVATAAYFTARARIAASRFEYLDQQYVAYMQGISDGPAKDEGVSVGIDVAARLLDLRDDDGYSHVLLYGCSSVPPPVGEFEPDAGCPIAPGDPQPADVKLKQIRPFTFSNPGQYRPDGPEPMTSRAYAADFEETREYGRSDSFVRTPEQTDVAWFWSEHPYVHWNRNLIALALSRRLNLLDAARFFAMVHTAAADATIAGFEAKYHYAAWRPRTAIPRAETDGNPRTEADPTWTPLLLVNHPEYPSGHGFWSTAVTDATAAFFGTHKVTWTITTSKTAVPPLVQTERTYRDLNALMREIDNARIWGGLHWRHSIRHGAQVGRHVTKHVVRNYFQPVRRKGPRYDR